jgi:amidase
LNLVPLEGHIITPPTPGKIESRPDYLTVAGPLARSADDLRLELEVVGGPSPREAVAYRWELPAPRHTASSDYRIGFVADDAFCPLSSEVAAVVTAALGGMRRSRMQLFEGWPEGLDPQASYDTFMFFLQAPGFEAREPTEQYLAYYRQHVDSWWGYYARTVLKTSRPTYKDWLREGARRLELQAMWRNYFENHDAFVMPITFVPAFPHNQSGTFWERPLETSHGPKSMGDIMKWPHVANLTGCPSTVVPAGRTSGGLPVGLQIMGPYLEDSTCLDIARRLLDVTGEFVAPPGFA